MKTFAPKTRGRQNLLRKLLFWLAVVSLVPWLCACSPKPANVSSPVQNTSRPEDSGNRAPASQLDFTLQNLTGIPLSGVYVSPSQSSGWEENVIEGAKLGDGDRVRIRFSPDEPAASWDLRIVAVNGRYADWKGLSLSEITTLRVRLKAGVEPFAVIEAD